MGRRGGGGGGHLVVVARVPPRLPREGVVGKLRGVALVGVHVTAWRAGGGPGGEGGREPPWICNITLLVNMARVSQRAAIHNLQQQQNRDTHKHIRNLF